MARAFSAYDARSLLEEHADLQKKLKGTLLIPNRYISEITTAAEKLVVEEILKTLRGVPIEELNRDKLGIRVKALRDHGYYTISDIATASVNHLASIHGISKDTAYTICRLVQGFVNQARKNTKIKISLDNKSRAATELVKTIYKYRKLKPLVDYCKSLLQNVEEDIETYSDDLRPATRRIGWFFAFKETKQIAEEAYNKLLQLLSGTYGNNSRAALSEIIDISRETTEEDAWRDFQKNSVLFYNILEDIVPGVLGTDDSVYGLPEDLAREIQDQAYFPDGLLCQLRRYQEWGVKYILHQEKVLLGDEMGLGKTVQAIAAMVSLKNTGATHFLVVCPASVITNWCREIASKSKLRVLRIHGTGRASALRTWISTGGVAVTTYETTGIFNLEDGFKFSMLVVDEAHYIKNPEAHRTMNVKEISNHSERLLFMTGTALENRVDEMVALIGMLQPSVARRIQGMEFMSSAPQFRQRIAPVYYRRKREDVLTELPDKIEEKEWCTLLPEEEHIYENAILGKSYADARRVSWNVGDLHNSSKAKRMLELIDEATGDGRKIIVFSFFLDTIAKVKQLLGDRCLNPINGSVPPARRQEIIDEFDHAPAGTVLVAQIQSGGTGLNIQSASVVIICEPQFKPSIENQAISRAYRMGQTRKVLVFRLLCENTIDEKITAVLEEKQALFDAFADKSEAAQKSLDLDEKTFGNIIQEEIDRINAKRGGAQQ